MKTRLRKEIEHEIKDKLLLKDASLWQIFKHLVGRYHSELLIFSSALAFGVIIGLGI